jgi:hypothetical protein
LTVDLFYLEYVTNIEYSELVVSTKIELNKLRILLVDGSFVEIFNSFSIPERWAFHWERKHLDGKMYRHVRVAVPDRGNQHCIGACKQH